MTKHPSHHRHPPTQGGAGTSTSLTAHLRSWLGSWPPATPMDVVGSPQRGQPGWDGGLHPVLEVFDPQTGTVLSVPPTALTVVRDEATRTPADLWERLPALTGHPDRGSFRAVMRWATHPALLPEAGAWVAADAPGVPTWLRPFGGHVLVATSPDGTHLAGVGIKRHTRYGHELAVVTSPPARGRGLGSRLVAQAARRVLDEGAIPFYVHEPANIASARVADTAGFPDHGWIIRGLRDIDHSGTAEEQS